MVKRTNELFAQHFDLQHIANLYGKLWWKNSAVSVKISIFARLFCPLVGWQLKWRKEI